MQRKLEARLQRAMRAHGDNKSGQASAKASTYDQLSPVSETSPVGTKFTAPRPARALNAPDVSDLALVDMIHENMLERFDPVQAEADSPRPARLEDWDAVRKAMRISGLV